MAEDQNNNQAGLEDLDTADTNAPVSFQDGDNQNKPAGQIRSSDKKSVIGRVTDYGSDYVSGKAFDKATSKLLDSSGYAKGGTGAVNGSGGTNPPGGGGLNGASGGGGPGKRPAWETDKVNLRADDINKSDTIRDRLRRGAEDRKAGAKFKEAYQTERRGRRVAETAKGASSLVESGTKSLGRELAKDTAKAGVKEVVKDTSKFAGREALDAAIPGAGLVTAIDVKGLKHTAQDTVRDIKDFHLLRAARRAVTGVGTSAAVTLFRASYDWYVLGWTLCLSLIVTWILGSILLFVPKAELQYMEKLGVVALNILIFFVLVVSILGVVVMMCSGLNVPGVALKLASYVSDTANSANEVCKTFSIFNVLSGGFGK